MPTGYSNDGRSHLAAAINNSITTITIPGGDTGKFPGSGTYVLRCENELMKVTGGQGTATLTVTRGVEGTTAASHLISTALSEVVSALEMTALVETTDSRMTNARTPTAHASSHLPNASDPLDFAGTIHQKGTHAGRPAAAASNNGCEYFETDTGNLFRSDGSVWLQIAISAGGGGSSTLAGDTDVNISSPANLDFLRYQTSDNKWHNSHGELTVGDLSVLGLTGSTAASRIVGATASGAPASGAHLVGDVSVDQTGSFWICTVAGTPGTFVQVVAGGGGSGAMTLISKQTASGSVSDFTFSSIAGTYSSLKLVASLRGTNASTNVAVQIQINGLTASQYYYHTWHADGPTTSSGTTPADSKWAVGQACGNTAPGGVFSPLELMLHDYANASNCPQFMARTLLWYATSNMQQNTDAGSYNADVAVTSIKLYPSSGSWASGSWAALYGIS